MPKPIPITMTLPAASDFVAVARLAVSGVAARMNFSVDIIEDIKVALSEACTNAVQHAYVADTSGNIDIQFNLFQDKLEIIVKDHGQGFNPKETTSSKQTEETPGSFGLGLGLTFIKSLMDEAQIHSQIGHGTTITMVKYVPQIV